MKIMRLGMKETFRRFLKAESHFHLELLLLKESRKVFGRKGQVGGHEKERGFEY